MRLSDLDYDHPAEAVAQRPSAKRDEARLFVRERGRLRKDVLVRDLPAFLGAGDVVVVNDSSVRRARLFGLKETGGRVEVLLLEHVEGRRWLALVRAARQPSPGQELLLGGGARVRVVARRDACVEIEAKGDLDAEMERSGVPPLPPYVRRPADEDDVRRYQTLHARRGEEREGGVSAAAPTAGLHLTPEVIAGFEAKGARVACVSLGVGLGTFRPVEADPVEGHRMHEEPFHVPAATAAAVNDARSAGRGVLAVGTTALRALEAAASPAGVVRAVVGRTGLFVLPGSPVRVVTRLLTNFHQPRTTLLALVQAFAGSSSVMETYAGAIASGARLFSYGDAMLLDRVT